MARADTNSLEAETLHQATATQVSTIPSMPLLEKKNSRRVSRQAIYYLSANTILCNKYEEYAYMSMRISKIYKIKKVA